MTQKELLYLEDAIGQEKNIISICNNIISMLNDKDLVIFMEKEVKKHNDLYNKLLNKLEGEC